jgi:hypothetical protein
MVGYCTREQIRDRLKGSQMPTGDTSLDASLELLIGAVSRSIDRYCHRPDNGFVGQAAATRVYDVPASAWGVQTWASGWGGWGGGESSRLLTPTAQPVVDIGWWTSVSAVASDDDADGSYEITWGVDDYDLLPLNAPDEGRPYRQLRQRWNGTKTLLVGPARLRITGTCGEVASASNPPEPVREAAILMVNRLLNRRTSPFGLVNIQTEFGGVARITNLDPDVKFLLSECGYVEPVAFA